MTTTCAVRTVAGEALVVPAGATVGGVTAEPAKLPRVPGFVESAFSPLVKAVVDRCLSGVTGGEPFGDEEGARTGLVLVSAIGDAVTTDLGSRLLTSGQVQNPLLFYQSVPTTILGVVARDHGITGPTTCVSARGDLRARALDVVDAILDDGTSQIVLIGIDLAAAERPVSATAALTGEGPATAAPRVDAAVAFLIRDAGGTPDDPALLDDSVSPDHPVSPGDPASPGDSLSPVDGEHVPEFGGLAGLVQLYSAVRARRHAAPGAVTVDLGDRHLRLLVQESPR
ncbi:hypothetical protein ACSDR0_41935 [Streptosporangium sp. G11]|uniref:hypothetical protein n=1 Tax=Streptosporangium sp. G11 TaxID=3436926 RepID=UPI003EBAE667